MVDPHTGHLDLPDILLNMEYADKMTINEQEKEMIVRGIVDSACKMMERIITRQSPKNRTLSFCKPHEQSKKAVTRRTILFNNLTKTQRLPARPRDFRINLEGQRDILGSELSDILGISVRDYLVKPKRNNFHVSRGRLRSDVEASGIAREPQIRKIIYEILSDSKARESIDNAILNSEIFYRFAKYCYEVYLYQMKENEQAFLNTTSAAIRKYGLRHKNTKEESDSLDIYARDLTPAKIDRLAKGYAINTINKIKQDEARKNYIASLSVAIVVN
ncbi:MAG TPA: hypothetical protein VEH06_06005 [Candidatus Bathyarchaeia archaeon]|nr:hypothetical protein [Candidatus Bathyarchaeia archaeon]